MLLRWGQTAFRNFRVVPPDTGIVHQINLEYLAPVVFRSGGQAYPDSVVGTDSHTTMVNGLGVLGWGVGGIEAEACMLGQPVSMLLPPVIGFKLHGKLKEGCTATDLVLTITQILRKKGVVGKFVEFFGAGLSALSLADIEYGINLIACFFIVHHHGGKIEAKSQHGYGTTFTLRLPLKPEPAVPPQGEAEFLQKALLNENLWEKLLASG